jgi:hypothetical protein
LCAWAELHQEELLRLTFADGTTGEVEVLERMRGPVFSQARTSDGFAKVTVDAETGTVVWPGGPTSHPTRSTSASARLPGPDQDVAA